MRLQMLFAAAATVVALPPPPAAGADGGPINFAREVLPILSNKCFVCHGPDTKKKGQLRLDSYAAATADRGGYRAIDTDAPEKSEILARIHDREDPMPPADAEKQLTSAERDLLTRWVEGGGSYAHHWAFVPPRKPDLPGGATGAAAIDAFIGARLEAAGTGFAPPADRGTLARRAALVLTGLPPEPAQLTAFLADDSDDAYGRLVEELLASPRYGEHQARYWLDAVRYGDTHGLHLDNRRGIYPYRDWVVRAFNANQPLDEFLTWQLAGDLLPDPTLPQLVATGFVRMNPTTAEGGAIAEEFQAKNNFDRVETLGTVLLGMTLTCARCHTHKYDPVPQTEYYRLMAFFNNTAEHSMDGNSYVYGPVAKVPPDQDAWDRWETLAAMRDRMLAEAGEIAAADPAAVVAHAEARRRWSASNWMVSVPVSTDAPAPPEDPPPPPPVPDPAPAANAEGEKVVKSEGEGGDKAGAGSSNDGAGGAPPASPPAPKMWSPIAGLPGKAKAKLPGAGQAAWVSVDVEVPVDQVRWLRFSGARGSQVIVDGIPLTTTDADPPGDATSSFLLTLKKGAHQVRFKLVGMEKAGEIEIHLDNPWEAVAAKKDWAAAPRTDRLRALEDPLGPFAALLYQQQARAVGQRLAQAERDFTTTLVARERGDRRATHLLDRGEYNLPVGDPLDPGILNVMGAFPANAPRDRLGLARWITSRDHPLVARVLVNRIWQRVFGHGLVRTPEDFGLQGEQPTHPGLLDWLAVELHDSGWDLKHLIRLMVTSRTFRQDSARRPDLDDPENRLLGRGPRYRLDAEVLRDVALWASELLDPKMGGEGVKPYQPGGLWSALAHPGSNTKKYTRDKGARLYRRSLYVYWKRTSPHPMMTLFDAPSREASCVRRSRTNTSLQSLALLNETQRIEMARGLAGRVLTERPDGGTDARLDHLFTLLASRPPTDIERSACTALLGRMQERYRGAKDDALAILAVGDAPRDESLDPAEHAAWTQVAATVLASDVAIMLY